MRSNLYLFIGTLPAEHLFQGSESSTLQRSYRFFAFIDQFSNILDRAALNKAEDDNVLLLLVQVAHSSLEAIQWILGLTRSLLLMLITPRGLYLVKSSSPAL